MKFSPKLLVCPVDQPWGIEAKTALKDWAENRRAEIRIVDTDRYGRSRNTLVDGENINRKLVAEGHAGISQVSSR